MRRRSAALVLAIPALIAGACSGNDDGAPSAEPSAPESTTTTATTTTEDAPAPQPEWVLHETGDDCVCADGSEYVFFSRTDDPERVVLYFEGGGACFSAETCAFDGGTYKTTTGEEDDPTDAGGILDLDDDRNPFAGWSVVYIPYCTGDVHLGDATTEYSPDLTVEHNGFVNASSGLDFLVEEYSSATEVFVTGSSAGGVPSPLFGGLIADALPDADVSVLADASGGYPSNPVINTAITGLWGSYEAAPPWPEIAAIEPGEYGIPDLFVLAQMHAPRVRMARYDNAFDLVQRVFSGLAGVGAGGLPAILDQNEELVEGAGIDLPVFIAPGEMHTILLRPDLYELEVDGRSFLDWLTTYVNGGDPGDVRCTDCGAPPSGT